MGFYKHHDAIVDEILLYFDILQEPTIYNIAEIVGCSKGKVTNILTNHLERNKK